MVVLGSGEAKLEFNSEQIGVQGLNKESILEAFKSVLVGGQVRWCS